MAQPTMIWFDQRHMRLGTCDFHCDHRLQAVPEGHLPVRKPRRLVEGYADLARDGGAQPRIVELGIQNGGSTAMLSELFQPDKLVAVELAEAPVELLATYIAQHGFEQTVRPYYGVDQSDRSRLTQILDDEFGDEALDLVIDDASHLYAETLASFDVLFPRLRPGGRFVIEDWRWEHAVARRMEEISAGGGEASVNQAKRLEAAMAERSASKPSKPTPFSRLVMELVLAQACSDSVAGLTMNSFRVVVERGPTALDAASFRLSDLYDDHLGQLAPR